jgi:hypothetical protein
MKYLGCMAVLGVLALNPSLAQTDQAERSRVQWLNGTSAPPLEFVLNRTTLSRSWAPGQRLGAGEFPAVAWRAEFKPPEPLRPLRLELDLQDGDSAAAVLVGDFAEVEEDKFNRAKLPPGYAENDERKIVRAGLIPVRIAKGRSATYPVYLLSGIPDETVRVEVEGGQTYDLEYGVLQSFQAAPGTRPELKIAGRPTPVGFDVDNISRGGLFAFCRPPGQERIEYGFLRLHSIESSKERAAELERREQEEAASD